jgi:hypothetical protein
VIRDVDGDINPGYADLSSGAASGLGPLPSVYMASDGTNVFFRFRVHHDPNDPAQGGFQSTTYVIQLAVGGVKTAAVGLNGKSASADYVYVSNADGSVVSQIYTYPFTATPAPSSAGARTMADGSGFYWVDFQVPIARITQVAPSITATTPLQLFYGSSQAANLSVINKDFMIGNAVSFTGLATTTLGPGALDMAKSSALVSGPNPPQVGITSTYDLTLTATNTGGNTIGSITVTDTFPANVTIVSQSTTSGTISRSGQVVTWQPLDLAPGLSATATIRVSITPTNADYGSMVTLNPGASGTATDTSTGGSTSDTSNAISVGPVAGNQLPTALADSASTIGTTPVTVDVLANDSDADGTLDPSTVTVTSGPASGTTSVDLVTGEITYTPNAGSSGPDTFTYRVCDDDGGCATATVTVTVRNPPDARDDAANTAEDAPVTVAVPANDSDLDGDLDATSVTVTSGPSAGSVSVNGGTGAITYTPNANVNGGDSFVYQICDSGSPALCDTATVSITVNAVNDPPDAVADSATTAEDTATTVDVVANDTDVEGNLDPTTVSISAAPANGSTSVDPVTGAVTYTPATNYNGADSFTYQVCDTLGACETATVSITVTSVNDAPVANDDAAITAEDTPVGIDVLANDVDVDGNLDPTTVAIVSGPANGSTSVNATTGEVTYTPDPDFSGGDTFTYRVCDTSGACVLAAATVTMTVTPIDDTPVAVDDSTTTAEDAAAVIAVLANDSDPDGNLDPTSVTILSAAVHGTTSVDPVTGEVTYTPEANYNGGDSFSYQVCDESTPIRLCDTATATVTVTAVNDAPVANDDARATGENSPITVSVLANDTDVDGNLDPTSVTISSGPASGTASVDPVTGAITYTPAAGYSGADSLVYRVCDSGSPALCDTATLSLSVTDINGPPTAVDDSATTPEDIAVAIDVPANDADAEGPLDLTSVTIVSAPVRGTVSVNPLTGVVTYTPNANVNGADSFSYQICDPGGLCDTAQVAVTINAVNDPPLAVDDAATTQEDTAVTITILANDSDVDGNLDPTTVAITSAPSNGLAAVLALTNQITYLPLLNFNGTDSLTYQVCDTAGACDAATVTVVVGPVNDIPDAVADSGTTAEDTAITIAVLTNDTDVDANLDPSTVAIVGQPSNGTVSVNGATGEVTYTPAANYAGSDSFVYQVCDTVGACDAATVSLTVTAANDPPVANDDTATTAEDTPVTIDVLANDFDVDGNLDPTTVTILSPPANGSTSVDPVTGEVTYTPDPDYNGSDSFTYRVCDSLGACSIGAALVSTTIIPIADPPAAASDSAATPEDTAVVIDLLANDTDPDGDIDPTTVVVLAAPAHGTVAIDPATGAATYTPAANYNGADAFSYQVCDASSPVELCDVASVSVTITAVADAPVANDDAAATPEDVAVTVDVLANDNDVDGDLDPTSVTVTAGPLNGTASVDPITGAITYTPDPGYNGPDILTYQVCDSGAPPLCDTATLTVSVAVLNDPPVALDDSATTPEDTPLVIDVLANDSDPDGALDPTSVSIIAPAAQGSLAVESVTGAVTYTPAANYNGADSFVYQVCDTAGGCDVATVSLTVSAVNDPPVANDDSAVLPEDGAATVAVPSNDTDVEGNLDVTTVTITSPPADGTASVDPLTGAITYTPDLDFNGTDSLTYEICDSAGACDTAVVAFSVSSVNDAPSAVDDVVSTPEDTTVAIDVLANDTDADGNLDPTSVSIVSPPAQGSVSVDPLTGVVSYTPDPEFNGTDSFTYEVCDSDGICDTATVSLTVTAVNDAPVAMDDTASTTEDVPVTVPVLANDSDVEGGLDPASVIVTVGPANGSISVDAITGEVTYTPSAGFSGSDGFTCRVCDTGGLCDTATVSVAVGDVNDAPTAADDAVATGEDVPVLIDVLANDFDPEGSLDPATVLVTTIPSNGTVSVDPLTGAITYTPNPDYTGADSFDYQVCDAGTPALCASASVGVTVSAVADAPVAVNDSASTSEDTPVTIPVPANDTDPDDDLDVTSVSVSQAPADGAVTIDAVTGEATYTPDADYSGADTFRYRICDLALACDTATVSVTVDPVADPPVAANDTVTTEEGEAVVIDVVANDSDPDGDLDPATVEIVSPPSDGTATVDAAGRITYDPDPDYVGSDTFTYRVCDAQGACSTATVTVAVSAAVPDSPAPVPDSPAPVPDGPLPETSTIAALVRQSEPPIMTGLILMSLAVIVWNLGLVLGRRRPARRSERRD